MKKAAPRECEVVAGIPEILRWLPESSAADRRHVTGVPCPHDCVHRMLKDVAEGPDKNRHQLVVCTDPDGCDGGCRGWAEANTWSRGRINFVLLFP